MDLSSLTVDFLTDPQQQPKVLEFFDALRASPDGWKACVHHVANGFPNNAQNHVWFLCFQVLEQYLTSKYANAPPEDRSVVAEFLRHLLIRMSANVAETSSSPAYVKNKLAQLFSSVFVADFPRRWRSFMQDVFLSNLTNDVVIEFYCRFLLAVDGDVADREVQRSKEETERNTLIKDTMRDVCVVEMVESWFVILSRSLNGPNTKVADLCLNVIGAYIAWIDIGLIANDRFVPLIMKALLDEETQEAAADCVCSILSKGMDPLQKLRLVEAFDNVLQGSGFLRFDKERDLDEYARVAVVVNCIGVVLIDCFTKLSKGGQPEGAQYAQSALESKTNDLLRCLSHEELEVCSCVTEFAHSFVMLMKQNSPLNDRQKAFVKELLVVVLRRYRFPDDYNFGHEGEDEAEFQEFRKELKVVFNNIAMLDNDLTMSAIEELVRTQLSNWRNLPANDVELAISLLFFLGDAPNSVNLLAAGDARQKTLKNLVELLITSDVSHHTHPAVSLQYLETVCRYDKFLSTEPSLLTNAVGSFLDERGLHNPSAKVRSRAAYLFTRFVRSNKAVLQQYVEQILYHLQDLLAVAPQVAEGNRLLSSEDQLFLFETTGTLIVSGNFSPEQKRAYMHQLLGSLATRFAEGFQMLNATADEFERKQLYDYLNCIMSYASRTTKAFSTQVTMKSCLSNDVFVELMLALLSAIQPSHAQLLQGLRQYLHRMVICLEDELLPHFPALLNKLLSISQDAKSLQDFLTLLQQAVAKYKDNLIPYLQSNIVAVWEAVWKALSTPIDSTDEVATRDYQYLRRSYFQLISVAAAKKVLDLFCLGGPNICDRLLLTVRDGALTTTDPTVQQQSFSIIHKCAEAIKVLPQHAQWVNQFVRSQAMRLCFTAPLSPNFDFADAQNSMVLYEIASCLKCFCESQGDQFPVRIGEIWLEFGFPVDLRDSFCFTVKTSDTKPLQKYLRSFFQDMVRLRGLS